MEELKAEKVERPDAASWDDCSEENRLHPLETYSQDCGRCSAPGCPLWGKGPLLVRSGNVVGRWRGNLTVGPWEEVAGGGSLERRASPGWAGLLEG